MMTETNERRLPVGIQSFEKIRKEGYLYVDKTDLVWNLVNKGNKYNYLSRPGRFGKSVLVDTLQAYFEGKKELFEGLKIMDMEKEWVKRPVIRLDMSRAGATASELRTYLDSVFEEYEKKYDIPVKHDNLMGNRLNAIITAAYKQTGLQVAVLVDDYDFPLLHSWGTSEYEPCTDIYSNIFCVIKADDYYEEFVFIAANTKLTQFSHGLNNLSYIGLSEQSAALCGFTDEEITDNFIPQNEALGKKNDWTSEETVKQLKANYGGYCFCTRNMVEVYNPSSLISALTNQKIACYMDSAYIKTLLQKIVGNITKYDCKLFALLDITMDISDVTEGGIELPLYQSGCLTIKEHQEGIYLLDIPNYEAKQVLCELTSAN